MSIVKLLLAIWIIGMAARWITGKQAERRQHREMEKLKREQIRQREEQRQMREEQREQARKQATHDIALEKARLEREELRREQEKQADEIAKLRHTIDQAQFDIDYLLERIGSIDTQTDYYIYLQSATVPGGDEWCKYQRRIDTLKAQAHAAETRLSKARFNKAQAERKMA